MVSEAIEWITKSNILSNIMLHYVDDFLFIGSPDSGQCHQLVNSFLRVTAKLGVPLALDKAEGPCTILSFLGIELNSVSQTMSLPSSKLSEINALLVEWFKQCSCNALSSRVLLGLSSLHQLACRQGDCLSVE